MMSPPPFAALLPPTALYAGPDGAAHTAASDATAFALVLAALAALDRPPTGPYPQLR